MTVHMCLVPRCESALQAAVRRFNAGGTTDAHLIPFNGKVDRDPVDNPNNLMKVTAGLNSLQVHHPLSKH